MLSEAEHLLDHAAEHRGSLAAAAAGPRWSSPAWLIVTAYYWAFFSAMALGRATGRFVWQLGRDTVHRFEGLGPPSPRRQGAGPYRVVLGARVSATHREIDVHRVNDRLHEAVWRQMFDYLIVTWREHGDEAANSLEFRAIEAFERIRNNLGADWPSAVRNSVNYRTGFAYEAVKGGDFYGLTAVARDSRGWNEQLAIDALEEAGVALRPGQTVLQRPFLFCRMLLLCGFLLNSAATTLVSEVLDRHGLDRRWREARARFLEALLA